MVVIIAILGGLGFMYMRFSNVKNTAGGVKLIGEFLIFFIYIVIVTAYGFLTVG